MLTIHSIISNSNGALRLSPNKHGAHRIQPVDSFNPPSIEKVLQITKELGMTVEQITPPGLEESSSSKFDTYLLKTPEGTFIKFVYGKGSSGSGPMFETIALDRLQTAIKTQGTKISPFVRDLLSSLGLKSIDEIEAAKLVGNKKVKRPISKEIQNVGKIISDIDIILKTGEEIHLSLKNFSGKTFMNSGYQGFSLEKDENQQEVFVDKSHVLDDLLVGALQIDKKIAASGVNDYLKKQRTLRPTIEHQLKTFDAQEIKKYLASAYGYGYWYIHRISEKDKVIEAINMTTPENVMNVVGNVLDVYITYPYWISKSCSSKQITAKIITDDRLYRVEVRNSHGQIIPNEIKIQVEPVKENSRFRY